MPALQALGLLMDLDGTIADTLPHLFRSFRHAVEPFVARPPSDEEIHATFGPAERECIARMLRNPAIARPGAVEHLDEATRRFHAYYEGRHDEVLAFPGILDAVCCARARDWRVGVFTGKGRRSAVFTLERLGVWPVDALVSSDDVQNPKPDPEGVHLAARLMRVPVEQLVVVGDAEADVRAGNAAGARTVAAFWGAFHPDSLRAAKPTWGLSDARMLRELIEVLAESR